MAFNINEFISNGLQFNGARPSQFKVRFFPPFQSAQSAKTELMVKAASLPADIIEPVEVGFYGRKVKVSGDRTYPDWIVDVYNDADFGQRGLLEKWHNLINTGISNRMDPSVWPKVYQQTADVIQYGQTGDILRQVTLVNLWPAEIGDIRLDWDMQNQIEVFSVRFVYDYWIPTDQGLATDTYNPVLPDDGQFSGNPAATQ
jgi:hypothetical protein